MATFQFLAQTFVIWGSGSACTTHPQGAPQIIVTKLREGLLKVDVSPYNFRVMRCIVLLRFHHDVVYICIYFTSIVCLVNFPYHYSYLNKRKVKIACC